MVSEEGENDEVLTTKPEDATEFIELRSGGCAGIDEVGWSVKLGTNLPADELLEKVEELRQQLLAKGDVKKVRNALKICGISKSEELIASVKRYNFDSQGITFTVDNYDSWMKLASGNGTIDDARYLVHEIAEVEELKRIQQQTDFDFIGSSLKNMTRTKRQQWQADFDRYYMESHCKALEVEYDFIAKQVSVATNDKVSISRNEAAAIDPSRDEARSYMLVDGSTLETHKNFTNWQLCGNKQVQLNRSQRIRLKFTINPTLSELVRAVKQLKINYLYNTYL